jgi:hypothetical protein
VCQIPDAEDFVLKDLESVHALREKADNFVKKVHEQRGDWRVWGQLANCSPKVGQNYQIWFTAPDISCAKMVAYV